ncbi:MAG TPA: ABC transporter substrate-binding protein [Acidimicrobiales bacterium]|nr:ABC transporter substrate-binding protein [Acidimicrobiales bacterium]
MSIGFNAKVRGWRGSARWLSLIVALGLLAAACGDDDTAATGSDEGGGSGEEATGADAEPSGTLRLGYFPNVTHAPAIIGVQEGIFEEKLGSAELELTTFNAGGEAIEAMLGGSIDATFIGPNPAINGYSQDNDLLRIVAGSTSGGASLVVREGVDSVEDLAGTTLASPALGNTQDVALRAWLADEGYETTQSGGGDVEITPQENPDTLTAFLDGAIDGAWLPEPWATRLVDEAGGHVLLNEADIWPDGQFVTTHLIVSADYLAENPANVRALIDGLLDAIDIANDDAGQAQAIVNDGIEADTTNRLEDETIAGAWENLTFTPDPIASSLEKSKEDAVEVELLEDVDLDGIYDLTILNELLAERGEAEVDGL